MDKQISIKKAFSFLRKCLKDYNLEQVKTIGNAGKEVNSIYIMWDIIRILNAILPYQKEFEKEFKTYISILLTKYDHSDLIQRALNSSFVGDAVMFLNTCNEANISINADLQGMEKWLIEQVWEKRVQDQENAVDNVLMLQIIYFILSRDYIIEPDREIFADIILDLSNVDGWKYHMVKKSLYKRKIHNSYHFVSPFELLYWISKIQRDYNCLYKKEDIVLNHILEEGFKNLEIIDCYEIGLLLASTPPGYEKEIKRGEEIIISRQLESGEWKAEEVIFDYQKYGDNFIGSSIYTTSICLEGILTAGNNS